MLTKLAETINAMRSLILIMLSLTTISGCSNFDFPWVYRIDVEQGNVIEEDKLTQLKTGMTQKQVRYLLGPPMIQDTFNPSRWDYFYSYLEGDGTYDRDRVTLYFDGNNLARIERSEYEPVIIDR